MRKSPTTKIGALASTEPATTTPVAPMLRFSTQMSRSHHPTLFQLHATPRSRQPAWKVLEPCFPALRSALHRWRMHLLASLVTQSRARTWLYNVFCTAHLDRIRIKNRDTRVSQSENSAAAPALGLNFGTSRVRAPAFCLFFTLFFIWMPQAASCAS